ncbi:MAG: LlaJI family restriction endonuclease, partial [Eubacterium sp.]|nr:LlaJI family restriction endonuclease [Eubacterium sp.]
PNNTVPTEEIKQIVEVLKKYNAKEETIYMLNGSDDSSSFNLLAVMLYLLNDYYENGIYNNSMQIIIDNGTDEILWDRTINDTFAIIQNNRPYYTALKTRKTIDNDFDFFKRLHECVLTNISKELEDASLLDIFGYETVELSDEDIDDFGDTDYILYRIEQELNIQFNTHKQLVLKTLYAYLSNGKTLSDVDTFSLFGTNSFNLVWQDVCEEVLDNKLHTRLQDLPIVLNEDYNAEKDKTLIEIIEKPQWVSYENTNKPHEVSTLEPDCISIDNGLFVISDAKYYNITLNVKEVKGQPGLESITKQYLYQLAYKDFISVHNLGVKNCFLAPTASEEVLSVGYVKMEMFSALGLENIEVRLLPVKTMYEMYLGERKLLINKLKL